jgi:hypothetical protein
MGIKAGAKGERAKREKGGKTTQPSPFSVPGYPPGLFLDCSQVALGNEAKNWGYKRKAKFQLHQFFIFSLFAFYSFRLSPPGFSYA